MKPFAIYYGWPSDVNGANGNVARSVAAFAGYSLVVFGEGNVLPGADALAGPVIAGVAAAGAVPYGYVDLGVTNGERNWTIAQMSTYMADWSALGAKGIFLDCAGADYGVSRARFDDAVNAAHDRGLRVIANAWNPDDVLSGSSPLGPGDGYLGENDVIAAGVTQPIGAYEAKLAIMSAYAHSLGVAMYETATFAPRSSDTVTSQVADQALAALAPYDVSGFQLTDPQYSSVDNRLRPASSW
ncbi:MAG: hypothetical protein ACRD0I_04975 [Acidimicrobiales bacterium]